MCSSGFDWLQGYSEGLVFIAVSCSLDPQWTVLFLRVANAVDFQRDQAEEVPDSKRRASTVCKRQQGLGRFGRVDGQQVRPTKALGPFRLFQVSRPLDRCCQ